MTSERHGPRAVVLGASIAGLLAARVLSEAFSDVLVLERDHLPDAAAARKGTPHALHPHGLLAKGLLLVETLFPGFTDALVARGGLRGDVGQDIAVEIGPRRLLRWRSGIAAVSASRMALEAELRSRVRALGNVSILSGVEALAPVHEDGRVVAARYRPIGDAAATAFTAPASLVIDCTGRGSAAPRWLAEWGYGKPQEERVDIGMAYTSLFFRRDEMRPELPCLVRIPTPALARPAAMLAVEPDDDGVPRWVVGLGGYAGDHVDLNLEAIARRAREIRSPEILRLAEHGVPVGAPFRYAFPSSLRRRYERLARFPAGFLPLGDALASFNPIYGQGMTVAAFEAHLLRDALRHGPLVPRAFLRAAAKTIDIPWRLAVGGDLAIPRVQGHRPLGTQVANAYVARLQRAAETDLVAARAFTTVMQMLEPPALLFTPRILWHAWRPASGGGAFTGK